MKEWRFLKSNKNKEGREIICKEKRKWKMKKKRGKSRRTRKRSQKASRPTCPPGRLRPRRPSCPRARPAARRTPLAPKQQTNKWWIIIIIIVWFSYFRMIFFLWLADYDFFFVNSVWKDFANYFFLLSGFTSHPVFVNYFSVMWFLHIYWFSLRSLCKPFLSN